MQSTIRTLLFGVLFGYLTPLAAQWQSLQGPYGGMTLNMLTNNQFIFLNTSNGIYRSGNDGGSWEKPAFATQLLYDNMQLLGLDEERLLAYSSADLFHPSSNKWLHLSADNGDTWTTTTLPDTFPNAPTAAGMLGQHILLADYQHIWESTDGGQTWANSPLGADIQYVQNIILDHQRFYVIGTQFAVSEPGGQNFTLKNLPGSDLIILDTLLFAYNFNEQRFYRAANIDSTWTACNPGNMGNSDHQIAQLNDTLYTLNAGKLAYSTDQGLHWTTVQPASFPYQWYNYIATHGNNLLLGGYSQRILRAPGLQGPWEIGDYGVANSSVGDLAFSNDYLFAGANNTGLFRYDLHNDTWDPSNLWKVSNQFTDAWTHDGLLYAAHSTILPGGGIGVSADDGQTWSYYGDYLPGNRITGSNQSLYLWSTGDIQPAGTVADHYRSDDGGVTWNSLDLMLNVQFPLLGLGDVAARGSDVWITTQHGLLHSADDGVTWAEQTNGLLLPGNPFVYRVFVVDSLLFAARSNLFYRSADNGQSWQPATSGLSLPLYGSSDRSLVGALVRFNGQLVALSSYGLYVSQDEGLHWVPYPVELPDRAIQTLAVHDSQLYMGTNFRGVWRGDMQNFSIEKISGRAYFDENNNGLQDSGETSVPGLVIQLGDYKQVTVTDSVGNYELYTYFDGSHRALSAHNDNVPYTVINSPAYDLTQGAENLDFRLHKIPGQKDLAVYLASTGQLRPGEQFSYYLQAINHGNTVEDAIVEAVIDPTFDVLAVTPAADEILGDTLRWYLPGFGYLNKQKFTIKVRLPATTPLGTAITNWVEIGPVDGDLKPLNNRSQSQDFVIGSYDPNKKTEAHNGSITRQAVDNGEALVYTIHFQNTGTAPAEKVVIADQLDPLLNAATIQVLTASHPFNWSLKGDGRLEFTFDMINLPDSMSNEADSRGFVTFSVKIDPQAPVNSIVINAASIYFDLNAPIVTKNVLTRITAETTTATATPVKTKQPGLQVMPNPSQGEFTLQWSADVYAKRIEVFNRNGQLVWQTPTGRENTARINLTSQPAGSYFAILTDRFGRHYPAKLILLRR